METRSSGRRTKQGSRSWEDRPQNSHQRRTQWTPRKNLVRFDLCVLRVLCGGEIVVVALRVAVIGVGYLGKHHARILSTLPGVELTAVVDINRKRADEIAAAHGTRALYDAGDVEGIVDAVTIAVP